MAELKTLKPKAKVESAGESLKEAFVGSPKTTKPKTSGIKVQRLSEKEGRYVKILSFGGFGTGKTRVLADLLELGAKIFVMTTDIGGDGLGSVTEALKDRNLRHLEENLYHVVLPTYEDVVLFINKPEAVFPEFYDIPFDLLAWDGFSGFQQYQLHQYILENGDIRDREDKVIVQQMWGAIKCETTSTLSKFLYMRNQRTGNYYSKYVTCLDNMTYSDDAVTDEQKKKKEVKSPFIQGSAQKLIGPAFDIILETRKETRRNEEGKPETKYYYLTQQTDLRKVKTRGVKLEPKEPADMRIVWPKIKTQLELPEFGPPQEQAETPAVPEEVVA